MEWGRVGEGRIVLGHNRPIYDIHLESFKAVITNMRESRNTDEA